MAVAGAVPPAPFLVVPARDFRTAKSRLAPVLGPVARAALARELLAHVLATARRAAEPLRVVVATDTPEVAAFAAAAGASALLDPPGGTLTTVVRAALDRLATDAPRVVCMADLPWLTPDDLAAALALAHAGRVALAPDHAGVATNLLALPAGRALRTAFGLPGSLARHLAAVPEGAALVQTPGLARDLDTPEDWARWAPGALPVG